MNIAYTQRAQNTARAACCVALILSTGGLRAQPTDGPPRKPPQEALDACKSLKAGQDCNFTSPRSTVKGSCFAPEGKPLACRPTKPPGGAGNGGASSENPAPTK